MRLSCQEDSRCFWLAPKQMNQLVTYMLQTIEPKINCLTTTLDMDKERTRLQRGLVCGGWKDDFSAGTLHSDFQQLITRIQSSLDVANLLKQLWMPALWCLHRNTPFPNHSGSWNTSQAPGFAVRTVIFVSSIFLRKSHAFHQTHQSEEQIPLATCIRETSVLLLPTFLLSPSSYLQAKCNVLPRIWASSTFSEFTWEHAQDSCHSLLISSVRSYPTKKPVTSCWFWSRSKQGRLP